ncbi:MAG: metal dependent phosphohydrolase, putative hydrolase of superfamily [Parcubacteria group bacterium]|nr:metal dependent phosphohydrolase, putative hydrolase of superfamily [Parcubacteria group bacterium]
MSLLLDFQKIRRAYHANGEERNENDVEHSYKLAMLAWYVASAGNTKLNMDLILRYALAHDLVEVHAGDTYIYSKDTEHLASKIEREEAAAQKLKEDFPEFPELHKCIQAYERREDKESRFVYALDKVLPVLDIYLDNGRSWKRDMVTLQMLIENKTSKVALSPEVEPYFTELLEILRSKEGSLFPKDT